jgi:hypothetical protein
MRFDNVIQTGVWTGSVEQIACVEQAVRDANFEGWDSIANYLHAIDESHNDDSADFDRGPIDPEAWELYAPLFARQWERCYGEN